MEKGISVKDIKPDTINRSIKATFLIREAEARQYVKGMYWNLKLADNTGVIDAVIWHPISANLQQIPKGSIAIIGGRIGLYREKMQITVEDLEILSDPEGAGIDMSKFMAVSPHDPRKMFAELKAICANELKYAPWRAFISAILGNADIARDFCARPAAKSQHHAYKGGLLEHTLGVCKLCMAIAGQYPGLDRQTLLAGALLHDIGKIRELSGGIDNDYTTPGNLVGHIFLGLDIIEPFLAQSSLDEALSGHLRHLILSHHGEYEFGAARLPQTEEAFVLHYADNLDAKLGLCRSLADTACNGWSSKHWSLNRGIHFPAHTPANANS